MVGFLGQLTDTMETDWAGWARVPVLMNQHRWILEIHQWPQDSQAAAKPPLWTHKQFSLKELCIAESGQLQPNHFKVKML